MNAAPASRPRAGNGAVLAVVCVALATVVSAMASLNVALPDIARSTHATQTQLAWIIDAYSLVFAALLLPAGAIGDRYGRRRALLVGLADLRRRIGIAMTSGSATQLIALRGVLGVGAALVMPATLSTITCTFPAAAAHAGRSASGRASPAASAVLGLLSSGLLLEVWSWQSVFGLNVVLAAVAASQEPCVSCRSRPTATAPRLDVGGALHRRGSA